MCDASLEKVSSCESSLEKVRSTDCLPESFENVPELKVYNVRIKASEEVAFSYDLKAGKALPYSVKLKGTNEPLSDY